MDKDKRIAELIAQNERLQREATILHSWQKGDAAVLEGCNAANKRLIEALKPFARLYDLQNQGRHLDVSPFKVEDLRRAYEALNLMGPKNPTHLTHAKTDSE